MSDKQDKEIADTAMENAVTRCLTRKEQRRKVIVLECYRDFWRRNQRPVCELSDADAYLLRAADIVIRIRSLVTPEGDTGSPDGTKVLRAQSEDDVEKAVLECVNHVTCGGNSAEMLWDMEQCPSADPAKFVRELVHSTLRDADKYVFPTLDESFVDRFIEMYDKFRPLGTVIEDDDVGAELEAVLEGMQKTVQALAEVEVPKQTLKDITNAIRALDEQLAAFLPKPKKTEQKQDQPAMESDASSSSFLADSCPATLEKLDDDTSMVSEEEEKDQKAEEPKPKEEEQPEKKPEKPADSTAMVDDTQIQNPVTRQDSCLLKINNISTEMVGVKPKVEEIEKLVDALDAESLSKDAIAGMGQVESLQKQSRVLSEQLMRALLALDAINTNETTRPLRRNQVIEVQQLLDRMDKINAQLQSYSSELAKDPAVIEKRKRESEASLAEHKDPVALLKEKEKEKQEKEKAEAKAKEPTPAPEKKEDEQMDKEDKENDEEEEGGEEEKEEEEDSAEALLQEMIPLWQSMKLRPRFDQQQQLQAYVLTAMIPGLNRDEIKISQEQDPNDGSDVLVVSGVRIPTLDEFKKMLRHINQLVERNIASIKTKRAFQLALMQLGKGRYGSFEERFVLPDDALVDSVHATYNGGRLGIVIPRQKQRQYAPRYAPRYANYPQYPFGGFSDFPGFF